MRWQGDCETVGDSVIRSSQPHESVEESLAFEERVRQWIACEIHDGFLQEATTAMMRLQTLLETKHVPSGPVRKEVELSLQLVCKAVADARDLISGLWPANLEQHGLLAAISQWIGERPPGGPSIDLEADVPFDRLEPLLESTVYRLVQEAATNVERHSKSDRAVVRLTQVGDRLQVEIRDWGIGFDPNGVEENRFGLRGIRERARLLGGRAEIDTTPGLGTRVFVDLPIAGISQKVATT
jgi:signal transduction histidine kinase